MKNYNLQLASTIDYLLIKERNMNDAIHGHDPLVMNGIEEFDAEQQDIFETALKDSVHSILKCYTGFFDIFSEPLQNSLDATEKKSKQNSNYVPKIWIDINIRENTLRIVDNGCGMNLREYKFCFRPSISYKRGDNLRGNKGVGATFLAYGYNYTKLQTKQDESKYSAILRHGRTWVEDNKNKIPRPTFEQSDFDMPELENESSGTSIEIILTGAENEKPLLKPLMPKLN